MPDTLAPSVADVVELTRALVRCEGGLAKGAYRVICRVCRGTGKAQGERG